MCVCISVSVWSDNGGFVEGLRLALFVDVDLRCLVRPLFRC